MKAMWVLAAGLLLAGCKLIDQTTFAPSPEATPVRPEAPKGDSRTPLLTIGYVGTEPQLSGHAALCGAGGRDTRARGGLRRDCHAARRSRRGCGAAPGTDVMRDIMAQGVPASRIHLGLRAEQAGTQQEVRVYVTVKDYSPYVRAYTDGKRRLRPIDWKPISIGRSRRRDASVSSSLP